MKKRNQTTGDREVEESIEGKILQIKGEVIHWMNMGLIHSTPNNFDDS